MAGAGQGRPGSATAPRATFVRVLRALVVSNMLATPAHPERGSFVRDQVRELRRLPGLQVELAELPAGAMRLPREALALRRGRRRQRFDVVHAHFGLTAWPALAIPAPVHALTVHGTDVRHPLTRQLTRVAIPLLDLLCAPSASLARELPWPAARDRAEVVPCGVDLERFRPLPRARARATLGLAEDRRYLLFPADPARPEKRHDRARALAAAVDAELMTLGGVAPAEVPLWVNAANAVIVPSDREGFGLAALEALACDTPVLATPVGAHDEALAGLPGAFCAPFELGAWSDALTPSLGAAERRIDGRERAERYSAARMAARVAAAWQAALARVAARRTRSRSATS